ncbi:MAG: hypothetical protein ABUL63_02940, partial [Acidobacteriota bacterium]
WGCTEITKTVTVLDPRPTILTSLVPVTTVEAGQSVPFLSTGKGQPPLTYTWKSFLGTDLVGQVTGAAASWNTGGRAPGIYLVTLTLSNASGSATSVPVPVLVVPPKELDFYTLGPCRILDTRFGSPLGSGTAKILELEGGCDLPAGARAIPANVTVLAAPAPGSVSFFPGNYPNTGTGTIYFSAGTVVANNAVLPLSTDGTVKLAALADLTGGGAVNVAIDVNGYFVEAP